MAWRYLYQALGSIGGLWGEHTAAGDRQTVSAERALGCPAHLEASQTLPARASCTEIRASIIAESSQWDSTTTSFRLGVMLKPNPSPAPFLDEESKAKVVRSWLSPPSYMGHSLGLTWPLPPAGSLGSVHRSPGSTQEDDSQSLWDRMDIVAFPSLASSKATMVLLLCPAGLFQP